MAASPLSWDAGGSMHPVKTPAVPLPDTSTLPGCSPSRSCQRIRRRERPLDLDTSCSTRFIARMVVVVPVHNEAGLLDECLASLAGAREFVSGDNVEVVTVVVLDACSDSSPTIAARHAASFDGVRVLTVDHRNVGAARGAGFASVRTSGSDSWFLTTDADTTVGQSWFAGHLRYARSGARAVAGTVTVDFDMGFTAENRAVYETGYHAVPGHRHVHGANIGVLERDYWSIGGFHPLATDEDVDLIRRLAGSGVPCVHAADVAVTTSGRLRGRTPGGFAGHLRDVVATS